MSNIIKELIVQGEIRIDEAQVFERVIDIIETRKSRAGAYANREVTLMYWEVGQYINSVVLMMAVLSMAKRFCRNWRQN